MKTIEEIIDQVEEELNDAEKYAWEAMHHKGKDTELSNTYSELSRQELTHADMLCNQAERLLRTGNDEMSKEDHTIWSWHHKKFQHKKHHIRSMLTSN